MKARLFQAYRRFENTLLTVLALAWLGILGDHGAPPDVRAMLPVSQRRGGTQR